ncbi:hypothetical protein CQ14_35955 [Bradyrhizobium lablabi]|uniref:T6SS Phospholipase effector Tle1-like catalytic domain-containing protein n=1 Tax=Bradyrhizobium lablabi TaxID=722472 RepID=A0A0R3MM41_9BRAD|nr:hypothetical protein CQ14_35955 [Bradyrhizobium lablabi]
MNTLLKSDATDGHAQIIHYSRGVGAIGGIRRYIEGGFANGIDVLIADLYVNLCSNYQPNDRIYIFGFSRGAVVARALTGLIAKGILHDDHINMFAHIWADYVGDAEVRVSGFKDDGGPRTKAKVANYRDFCSETDPTIEFLGVFDAVSGGRGWIADAQRLRIEERSLQAHVKNALHLLAIDETRPFFRPIMWTGVENPEESFLEQIWMPGVHSDAGAAYENRTLGNIALMTMIDRVKAKTVLNFDMKEVRKLNQKLVSPINVRIHNEYDKYWYLVNPWPRARRLNPDIPDQTIHPLGNYIQGNLVRYKAKPNTLKYRLPERFVPENYKLAVAPEFLTEEFESIF